MEKLKERIHKLCTAIIEKFRQLAEKISNKLKEVSYIALQEKIRLIIKTNPSLGSTKIPVVLYSSTTPFIGINSDVLKDTVSKMDTMIDQFTNEEKYGNSMKFNASLMDAGSLAITIQTKQLEELIDKANEPKSFVTLSDFANDRLFSMLLRGIKESEHCIAFWEDNIDIFMKRAEKSGCTNTVNIVTSFNNCAMKYYNTCLRFQNIQFQQLLSGVKKVVSEMKSSVDSTDSKKTVTVQSKVNKNPNESEVQKTVSKQNKASKEQKSKPLNESYDDLYLDILAI